MSTANKFDIVSILQGKFIFATSVILITDASLTIAVIGNADIRNDGAYQDCGGQRLRHICFFLLDKIFWQSTSLNVILWNGR